MDDMVIKELGVTTARITEIIYESQPHYNKAKLRLSEIAEVLRLTPITVRRSIEQLIKKGYFKKVGRSEYAFTIKFFETFTDYPVYEIHKI